MAWHSVASLINLWKVAIFSAEFVRESMFTLPSSIVILCKPVINGCSSKCKKAQCCHISLAMDFFPSNQLEYETINICSNEIYPAMLRLSWHPCYALEWDGKRNTKGEIAVNVLGSLLIKEIAIIQLGREKKKSASSGTTKIQGGVGS